MKIKFYEKTLLYFSLFIFLFSLIATPASAKSGYVAVSCGGRIYYEERGKGEALILLHGHSLDRRMWNEQFRVFARHYRTIRLDFRGYGRSSAQREGFQFTHVDDLITLMDSLRIEKANIVGLSMGAFIAGDMVGMYPERVKKCVLASGSIRNTPGPGTPFTEEELAKMNRQIAERERQGLDAYKKEWLEVLIKSGGTERERMRRPLWRMVRDWSAWQAFYKEMRLYYANEAFESLKQKRPACPVLFLYGENDTKPNPHNRMQDYLQNSSVQVLKNCGHMMNMDQPAAFNQAVLSFLSE